MNQNITKKVREIIQPVADEFGYFLWDVEFVKEGADKYLRITIDKEDGINIDDCEKMHRAIDPLLDEADPISEPYILEVSSPGIERELKSDEHIEACTGWDVELKFYVAHGGSKSFRGTLAGLSEDKSEVVVADGDGNETAFKRSEVAKISTYYEFEK